MRPSSVIFSIYSLIVLSFHANASQPLNQLKLADNGLLKCIEQQASENNWRLVSHVDELKCHGLAISNLDGLQVFTQLKSLSLYNNKLQQADLRHFNQLEYLNIAGNKLKTVNVSGLNQLKTLYLFKNKLKTIDFNGLSQLKKIRITNNLLETLDITPLTALEKAYFFDNKLEDLVVKGLPKLKFIELRQNPMPDEVYDRYDAIDGITIVHDGNADDWK
jgi:protein phosphatase 1 regulatory subunit 7